MGFSKKEVSKIALYDYCEGDVHHRIFTALQACKKLHNAFVNPPYTVNDLDKKQETLARIVYDLTELNADIANQIRTDESNDDSDGHIIIQWLKGDEMRTIDTTLGEIKKDGIILDEVEGE